MTSKSKGQHGLTAARALAGLGLLSSSALAADPAAERQCRAIAAISTTEMEVVTARLVEQPLSAGEAQRTATSAAARPSANAGRSTQQAFCRVEITMTPAPGAEIRSEVWLPLAPAWNGRMLGTGNGGAAGAIQYGPLVEGLNMGYAVTNTDVGTHPDASGGADPASFRFGFNPELRANYVWRGVHSMTTSAKKVIQAFYGKPQSKALFVGCSTGGGEAAAEIQRFPDDYDGVLMGSPSIYFAQLGLFQGWAYAATHQSLAHRIGRQKLPALAAEVLRQCDTLDGVKDGVIENPRICKFDPTPMTCKGVELDSCLLPQQVEAVKKIYGGLRNPRTNEVIYYGLQPGVELAEATRVRLAQESIGSVINPAMFGPLAWVLGPDWKADNWLTFDWDKGSTDLIKKFAPYANDNPDIRPFVNRGGKLIMWAGWGDPNFPEFNTARYYEDAEKAVGAKASESMRMYLAPGVYHCGGGPGPNQLGQAPNSLEMTPNRNLLVALDQWVTKGVAPQEIIATKFINDDAKQGVARTRPVCPYPKVAKWGGKGSTDDHKSFTCVTP